MIMIFIILSSLIYLSAFIYPSYLWPGVFIWMTLLVIHDIDNRYGYRHGFIWGIIFFAGHFAWFAKLVMCKEKGDAAILLYLVAVLYFTLFAAFWMGFKQLLFRIITQRINLKGKWAALCWTWVISTATFICLTCYCSLAILDCFEGYPFINPVLPLVSWKWYLRGLPYFGCVGYIIIIVVFNVVTAELYRKFDSARLMAMIILLGFPALLYDHAQKKVVEKNDFFYLQPRWINLGLTASQNFYEIGRQLNQIALIHSDIKYIVMPESSFGCNLLDWQDKLEAWTGLFTHTTTIFCGGHRYHNDQIFNCLYAVCNGKIVGWYDKQHLVPFVERMPYISKRFGIMQNLFMSGGKEFSYPSDDQLKVMHGFTPCICSELFFHAKQPTVGNIVLFICNDSWLICDYAKELALRSTQVYSLVHQVGIIYVSHDDMKFISC